ncbi:hypothetical protein BCR24_15720 [Enterococcus ureilyticus]|uniref:Gram-positive cocci surface proteins LPxTG domain-containing protein n=2 Tax=Enterococcus ureilyticus TaxID=1131292 RepID=A0A1E5HBR7_9ENTE|nr:MucBP domain-containing protein [Enterococcus ureilyticus]OEG22392.1 hypothetical protein BCR24_15720 [Enterococcus ureilyticus]
MLAIFVLSFQFIPSGIVLAESTVQEQSIQENDRIELPNDTVTLNVGDIFSPENYATAFRGDQEIPYGDGEFTAIFNDVDTSKAGTYTITYRLENVMAGTFIDKTMTVIVQDNDRIELPNDTVTLNVGDIFSPENYATAFRGDQEIPYGDGEFTAIFNDVDTSKAGTYTITYRLENVMAGTFIDKTMTVIVQDSILGADVTIHYQDTEGNTIAPDVVKSGNIGDPYSFEQLTIDGYTFKEVNGNPNGTFTDTAQTVTYVYTKNTINQPLEPTKPSESYTKPVVKAKTINSASTTATLPQTGETNSPLLTDVGAMILLASGAYILTFKRKKSN